MANHVLLNNVEHKDLRIDINKSDAFGDNKMFSVIFPFEFRNVQANYPIIFTKHPETGEFTSIALFGFEKDENLFLNGTEWDAQYIPLMMEREPFLIGYQEQEHDGNRVQAPVLHIDMDSPRVGKEDGVELFLPHGGNSEYLNRISSMLKTIHDNQRASKEFIETLVKYELLESFNLDITLKNQQTHRLAGFYTVNEDKLAALSEKELGVLSKNGMLPVIYMIVASQAQFTGLVAKKNRLLG